MIHQAEFNDTAYQYVPKLFTESTPQSNEVV